MSGRRAKPDFTPATNFGSVMGVSGSIPRFEVPKSETTHPWFIFPQGDTSYRFGVLVEGVPLCLVVKVMDLVSETGPRVDSPLSIYDRMGWLKYTLSHIYKV